MCVAMHDGNMSEVAAAAGLVCRERHDERVLPLGCAVLPLQWLIEVLLVWFGAAVSKGVLTCV